MKADHLSSFAASHSIRHSEHIWGPYLRSYYLTLGPRSEREECRLTVWSGSCFTLGWAASCVFFSLHWRLFFGLIQAVWRVCAYPCVGLCTVGGWRGQVPVTLRCFVQPVKIFFNPPGQSNPPTLMSLCPGGLLEAVVTAWRAVAKSQVCWPNPPETCAKKHLAHLERQLTLECRDTRVWVGLIHWSCVFVGSTGGVFKYVLPCPHPKTHTQGW